MRRVEDLSDESANKMALRLRELSGISAEQPLDYGHSFSLLAKLNVIIVFRNFPTELGSYAIHSKICKHRVIFVDTKTNVLDLIFQLLHETVHAVRDEGEPSSNEEIEEFCDAVSNYAQFPDSYVDVIAQAISVNDTPARTVNLLKHFCSKNGHSMYGIVKMLQKRGLCTTLSYGGADTKMKKEFHTIESILFQGDCRKYVEILTELSPHFVRIMRSYIISCSVRKVAELMGLENISDANEVREELMRLPVK